MRGYEGGGGMRGKGYEGGEGLRGGGRGRKESDRVSAAPIHEKAHTLRISPHTPGKLPSVVSRIPSLSRP